MTARKIDHKRVDPSRAVLYWEKAQDFFRTMRDAAGAGNWHGAGLAAVHCAISATDALLVARIGIRSGSRAHEDVVALLLNHIRHPRVAEESKRLGRIIGEKNLIEYVDKGYGEKEALSLLKLVERYMAWVQELYQR